MENPIECSSLYRKIGETASLQARGADTVKWSSQLGQLSSLEGKRVTYIAPKTNDVEIINLG
ncbi:hypothetical protein [Candidatus Marithrix sp. Canyon 246]|uniref:hypothetical protein n=1 Tax=Candidatus Marithrix sp. Canyon 246 TaxID=1827136 RepID=UPI00114D071F|nr:hypothetical protein [Candidatus Marithrix sp. Canyon 246]